MEERPDKSLKDLSLEDYPLRIRVKKKKKKISLHRDWNPVSNNLNIWLDEGNQGLRMFLNCSPVKSKDKPSLKDDII